MELKRTPLYQQHVQAGGRMVNFSGWALPVEYTGALSEAKSVRTACGLFDASHMGRITVSGKSCCEFLQYLTSNNLAAVKLNQLQYNLLINPEGGIIDDMIVYRKAEDSFLCVVNASNKDKVYTWLRNNSSGNIDIRDDSRDTALLCLQGPLSCKVMEAVFGRDFDSLPYMHFVELAFDGKDILISRSGYTGEDGFEIYTWSRDAAAIWDRILKCKESLGISLCGLGARDILRIEAGYPLYGHELSEDINPFQASLSWAVKLTKDFVGKSRLLRIRQEGLKRKRIGFMMAGRAFARQGYALYSGAKFIGGVSSGSYSPNLNRFIGMGFIDVQYAEIGRSLEVKVRDKFPRAEVSPFPFIKVKTKQNTKNQDSRVLPQCGPNCG